MKEKTSITLSPEILVGIDQLTGSKKSRSAVIEDILRQYIREQTKAARRARDLAILNRYAGELNRDAEDGLDEQSSEED
jgi:metal-responsive CopG/Arc/MetJ family transcriptional regulator